MKERSLFNDMNEGHVRKADLDEIERFVARRLRSLFETVLPPKRLKSDGGVHSFSLFLAISSRQPAAIRLATRIGNHILKSRA